ncbi:interferon alpha-inducible protein 27-like protein 2A [Chelonus insularis]|uniref:interferon alpha-inducible protein 27-like protein 2A n=1 Tax=Chelonus insularis TaxID=460826 RepID=UPI00158D0636|nr:interferon alpha-inducible protein 27-like protein 2A [Chelonus insularis]
MSANFLRKAAIITAGGAIGTGIVVFGAPLAVAAVGFGSSGITAGSTAAWLMSLSGGATQAGSVVAVCQSIGATGAVATSTSALGGVLGGAAGYFVSRNGNRSNDEPNQRPDQEPDQRLGQGRRSEEESSEENEEDEEQNV